MKWFLKCIKNYVNFSGRARRKEYWNFVLFYVLFLIAAAILDMIVFSMPSSIFYFLVGLFLFLPNLAVMVRRLHDTGRSGKLLLWYYLASFIWVIALLFTGFPVLLVEGPMNAMPMSFVVVGGVGGLGLFVWSIFFLVWCCTAGTVGDNKYGPDPKAEVEA